VTGSSGKAERLEQKKPPGWLAVENIYANQEILAFIPVTQPLFHLP
jgi:hypothetical protein